ncbi:MAG TPA: hypothetical protein PJ986_14780 [Gammaproteobacteria bacterium]|nr:hypothetical protein [Gammaproteobacteria bacterium]
MPTYEIESNGKVYEIEAPNAQAASGAIASLLDEEPQGLSAGIDFASGFNRGVAGAVDIAANPVSAILRAAGIPTPDNPTQRAFGMMGLTSENNGALGRIGQEVGSGLPLAAATLGTGAIAAPARYAAGELASSLMGGAGAAIAQRMYPDNALAEVAGQVIGGAAPGLLGAGLKAAMSSPEAAQNLSAFDAANVTPTAGQVTGNAGTQTVEGMLRGAPGSTHVMAGVAEDQARQMGSTADDIASRLGGSTDELAGRAVEKGIGSFVSQKQKTASNLWARLDQFIAPDTPVALPNTRAMLSELSGSGKLTEAFTSPVINKAVKAVEGISATPYQELRDLRSLIGARLGDPQLISDIPRSELKRLYGALTQDIKEAAAANGGLQAFDRANTFTRALHDRVDSTLEPLLRRTTPEKLFSAVRSGDASSLRRLGRTLNDKTWRVVAGSVIKDLGTAKAGAQNAAGNVFSPETFLTNFNKLDPETRSVLFGRIGVEKELNSLAKVAELMRSNSRVMANPSGSTVLGANLTALGFGTGALASGNLGLAGSIFTGMAGANGAAHLFTSPKFVRWLASSARAPVEQLPNLTGRLLTTMEDESEEIKGAAAELVNNL